MGEGNGALGAFFAFVGLIALTSFSQTARHLTTSVFSTIAGALCIPGAVALVWRLAVTIGWWTIPAFVLAGLLGGAFTGYLLNAGRRVGVGSSWPYEIQTFLAWTWVIAAVLSWSA